MNAQMKRGVMEMCILHYISIKDLYGYDVMRLMGNFFPDVDTSTFYSVLRRLHKDGSLSSYDVPSPSGPRRKYYTITDSGRKTLEQNISDWKKITQIAGEILSITKL